MLPGRTRWRTIAGTIKVIYTALTLACIIFLLFKNKHLMVALYSAARMDFLAYAISIWGVLHLIAPFTPLLVLKSLGYSTQYRELLKIYFSRLPARYLPGGIWHTVGRMVDYRSSYDVSRTHLSFLILFESIFPIPITLLIGGTLLWINGPGSLSKSILLFCIPLSLISLFIPLIVACLTVTKKFFRRGILIPYLSLILLSFCFWFAAAGSFYFYFSSVTLDDSTINNYASIAGTYIFSWGVGYIAVFAPQGIGVFEVIAGKIMNFPVGLGSTVAFLAGFRLLVLVSDILMCTLYMTSYWLLRGVRGY